MTWTTARPTQAGWYWYKPSPEHDYAEVLLVLGDDSEDCPLFAMQNGVDVKLSRLEGEWQGPIEPGECPSGKAKVCAWKYDSVDDYYDTACGNAYCLSEGTLADNDHRYCPYCGGLIDEQVPVDEEVDE